MAAQICCRAVPPPQSPKVVIMRLIEASSFRFSRLTALTILNQTAGHNSLIDASSLGPLSLSALTMHPEQSRRQQDHGTTLMPCGNSDIDMRQYCADA